MRSLTSCPQSHAGSLSELKKLQFFIVIFLENYKFFKICGQNIRGGPPRVVAFPGTLRNRQKIKWTYLRLHTTHPLDFWYMHRYCQYLLQYQKSSAWVVCRRRYGNRTHFNQQLKSHRTTQNQNCKQRTIQFIALSLF